ncbi:MAG: hypothetical protein CL840_13755 [Crocinitomicaceae bacterium]|nr:hypothetical protein [Crocinitomicaceae bacterium]
MKRFLRIFIAIAVVAVIAGAYIMFFANYSTGYRVGTIIKMTKRGVIFKTYEGQLHTGGLSSDAGGETATSMWDFSVHKDDESIRNQIEDAVDNGSRVKLYYDEKFYQWAIFGDTKYFVNKVEVIEGKQ